jgi:predicted ferric reductase
MPLSHERKSPVLPSKSQKKWRFALIVFALHILLGLPLAGLLKFTSAAEPFSRQWYLGLGIPLGVAAMLLMAVQFVIAAKFKALDRVFALNRLFGLHRKIGMALVLCALAHPLIINWPELTGAGTFEFGPWPAVLGLFTLLGLLGASLVAIFRERLRLPFHIWRPMHRWGMTLLAILALVHSLFIQGHLEFGPAQIVLLIALAAIFIHGLAYRGVDFKVTEVQEVGRSTFAVNLAPGHKGLGPWAPGQFALVTFLSASLPKEEHPWTISSSPVQGPGLELTIKESGDFTNKIKLLKKGDLARVRGPYGHFSYLGLDPDADPELVMIAGGVGITPFLSMLRHMAEVGDKRRILLIWSNRTKKDILWNKEFEALAKKLPGLELEHVLTRQPDWKGPSGHLDPGLLKGLLKGTSPKNQVFVCGPAGFMDLVQKGLKELGFREERIQTERFAL